MLSPEPNEPTKKPVIVLLPNSFVKGPTKKLIQKHKERYDQYSITLIADDEIHPSTFKKTFDHLSTIIKSYKDEEPLVIPTHDKGALMHAALAKEFPYIVAPSLQSAFICLHKGETYKICPEKTILPFIEIPAQSRVCSGDVTGLGSFPFFIKPSLGTNSEMTKKINSLNELNSFICQNDAGIAKLGKGIFEFLYEFLDEKSTGSIGVNSWIVQPFVSTDHCNRLLGQDGLVHNGEITPWNVHEFIFWERYPSMIKSIVTPTIISRKARMALNEAYIYLVAELIRKGFDNQFATLEAFVSDEGCVRIAEVNGRTLRMMIRSYTSLYGSKGDSILAMIDLASGYIPQKPVEKAGIFTSLGYICVKETGMAIDIVDFDAACQTEEIELRVNKDTVISSSSEWGFQVAICYTSGGSVQAALEACRQAADKIIISKEKCLWLTETL